MAALAPLELEAEVLRQRCQHAARRLRGEIERSNAVSSAASVMRAHGTLAMSRTLAAAIVTHDGALWGATSETTDKPGQGPWKRLRVDQR